MTGHKPLEATIPVRVHCSDCCGWRLWCPWCGEAYGGIVGDGWHSGIIGAASRAFSCRGCGNTIKMISWGFTYASNGELLATASTLSDSLEKLAAALALPAAAGTDQRNEVEPWPPLPPASARVDQLAALALDGALDGVDPGAADCDWEPSEPAGPPPTPAGPPPSRQAGAAKAPAGPPTPAGPPPRLSLTSRIGWDNQQPCPPEAPRWRLADIVRGRHCEPCGWALLKIAEHVYPPEGGSFDFTQAAAVKPSVLAAAYRRVFGGISPRRDASGNFLTYSTRELVEIADAFRWARSDEGQEEADWILHGYRRQRSERSNQPRRA